MSTIKVTNIEHASTGNGGIQLDNAGHVTVDGQQMPTAGALSNRNLIANGNFQIDQRNAGGSITTSAGNNFPVDRWLLYDNAGSDFTSEQDTDAPAGHDFSLLVTSAAATSPGANDYYFVCQRIEGNNVAHLNFGSSDAQKVTISFYVKSSLTGTFSGALGNASFNRAYPFTYSISSANTWEQKTVTIAGDTAGTWATNNTTGLQVLWDLGSGTNRVGTAGAWVGSDHRGVSSSTQIVATSGATFRLAGVQVEVGSKATPFEHRSYGDELARCQRYYYRHNFTGNLNGGSGGYYTAAAGRVWTQFPVTMRTSPTLEVEDLTYDRIGAGGVTATANTNGNVTTLGATWDGTGLSGGTFGQPLAYTGRWNVNAEL